MEMSRGSNFWGITLLGGLALLNIAARLFRHPVGLEAWDYFEWSMNAALVVVIWFGYRRQLRDLDKLTEQVEKKTLSRIYLWSNSMIVFAFLFLLQGLSHMHRH